MSTIDRIRGLLRAETTERPWRAEKDHADWNVEAGPVEMVAGTFDGSERRRRDNAQLIVELVNNAEALCDLADAARELPPDGDLQTIEGRALRDRFAAALAGLDGDAEGE